MAASSGAITVSWPEKRANLLGARGGKRSSAHQRDFSYGIVGEMLQLIQAGLQLNRLVAKSLPTTKIQGTARLKHKGRGMYPACGMAVEADLRVGSVLGIARGLLAFDVGD